MTIKIPAIITKTTETTSDEGTVRTTTTRTMFEIRPRIEAESILALAAQDDANIITLENKVGVRPLFFLYDRARRLNGMKRINHLS